MNYRKLYESIIEKRKFDIPSGYVEEHHIIPRSLGGTDDKSNLVKLTAKEHFICHLLLTKIYEKGSLEYYKMCHAFLMMLVKGHKQKRYITSRKYEKLKVSFSKRMSVLQGGKNNSQYGMMWIHNKTLKQCKKVPKDSILEEGWEVGRILNWVEPKKYVKCCYCSNLFLLQKREKFCSKNCKIEYKLIKKNEITDDELRFMESYNANKSISLSLREIGKPAYGSYYNWAKNAIKKIKMPD